MKPKAKEAARAISRIELWADPETGLPARHKIVHAAGETELTIRYHNVSRNDELPGSIFLPEFPDEIEKIRY